MSDPVNHPEHYGGKDNPFETIKVLAAWLSEEEFFGFLMGNVIKYTSRVGKKGDVVQDMEKAKWYLQYAINWIGNMKPEEVKEDKTPLHEIDSTGLYCVKCGKLGIEWHGGEKCPGDLRRRKPDEDS